MSKLLFSYLKPNCIQTDNSQKSDLTFELDLESLLIRILLNVTNLILTLQIYKEIMEEKNLLQKPIHPLLKHQVLGVSLV